MAESNNTMEEAYANYCQSIREARDARFEVLVVRGDAEEEAEDADQRLENSSPLQ